MRVFAAIHVVILNPFGQPAEKRQRSGEGAFQDGSGRP